MTGDSGKPTWFASSSDSLKVSCTAVVCRVHIGFIQMNGWTWDNWGFKYLSTPVLESSRRSGHRMHFHNVHIVWSTCKPRDEPSRPAGTATPYPLTSAPISLAPFLFVSVDCHQLLLGSPSWDRIFCEQLFDRGLQPTIEREPCTHVRFPGEVIRGERHPERLRLPKSLTALPRLRHHQQG